MNRKSALVWVLVIGIASPFLAYGIGQFLPFYDGFVVTSGSMEPEIQTGAILFTQTTSAEEVNVGDTITYQSGDSFTTHKVIQKNTSDGIISFRTQGVANEAPDPEPVTENQLAGKKLFSIPYIGYIITWAGTTTGRIMLIVVPAVLIVLMEIRSIAGELKGSQTR